MTKEYADFLAHYGVKGQKWGVRNWQNEDGSYTTAGAERYWGGGHGRQPGNNVYQAYKQSRQATTAVQKMPKRKPLTKAQVEARKKRTKIVIGAAAAVAVTALAVYGAKRYRNTTKMRDLLRRADFNSAIKEGHSREEAARVVQKMHTRRSSRELINSAKRNYKQGVTVRPHKFSEANYSLTKYRLGRRDQKIQTAKKWMKLVGLNLSSGAKTYGQYQVAKLQNENQNTKKRRRTR